jgi:ribonuclease-3
VSGDGSEAEAVEAALGYAFRDRALAETALRHASYSHEANGLPSNERLEFLGDAVLGLVAAEDLYRGHAEWPEGPLTRARAALVNGSALARCARVLGLGAFVRLGRTEQRSGGEDKERILAGCFEALLGAVYLDGGLEAARAVARRAFEAAGAPPEAMRDPKTAFQEWAHARFRRTPSYRLAHDSGVDADDARFTVELFVDEERWGLGRGRTKRAAERGAAEEALARAVALDG